MKKSNALWFFMGIVTLVSAMWTGLRLSQMKGAVFLRDTDHKLHVYRIFGVNPGIISSEATENSATAGYS